MDKLLTADDVAAALQVSRRTAYAIMHQMPHLERPFRVSPGALAAWTAQRTLDPDGERGRKTLRPKRSSRPWEAPAADPFHIPRRRAQ